VGSISYSRAIRPDTAYIKKIIESSLLCDWAIRVEYVCGETEATCWQVWDKAFFAIRSAEAVIAALMDCYQKHPNSTIRIHAEKFRPQSNVLYTVYNPQYLAAETHVEPRKSSRKYPQEQDKSTSRVELRT